MNGLIRSRATLIWLLLVGATLLSWEMGHGVGIDDARLAGAAIIAVSFVKVRFVVFEFMEIRGAPRWMRVFGDIWITLITALLIGRFLLS